MEVEGEEICARDEGCAVAEADEKGGDVGAVFEEAEGHDRVDGEFPFVEEEEDYHDDAEDEEAEDCGGGPGVGDPAVFEAEEEHDCAADDSDGAEPVDGFEAGEERSFGGFNVKVHEDDDEGDAVERD